MTSPIRVVIDTNVLVSALVFGAGRLSRLRAAWQDGRLVPLLSRTTAAELLRVLTYPKFRLSAVEQQELLGDLLPWSEIVRMPARLPAVPPCRDPFDRPFLELALVGRADHLVTGDEDLLAIRVRSISIITPAALLALVDAK